MFISINHIMIPMNTKHITEYIFRINKAMDYIEKNLGENMTLEDLARSAHFSKYHFNRIFHSMVGETPFQFIQRLRLEKAASLIPIGKESITEIAFKCGFSDVSIFSRNFKRHFKTSPSQYKKDFFENSNMSQVNSKSAQVETKPSMYFCSEEQTIKWRTKMDIVKNVEIQELPGMTLAYIRNMGPYDGNNELYQKHREKLFAWAGAQGLFQREDFKYLILYHDNPKVALGDNLRMSLCVTAPKNIVVEGEIGKMDLEPAKYVVCRMELTARDFSTAWDWIYSQWFPNSGYQPDDKPYFETYPEMPKGEKFLVDFCIPVQPL